MRTEIQSIESSRGDGDSSPVPDPSSDFSDSIDADLVCPECEYQLTGASGDRCPWCGWAIDARELAASAVARRSGRRWGVTGAALLVGVGSLIVLRSVIGRASNLAWRDGLAVLAVVMASAGHLALAAIVVLRRNRWPMRAGEAATILRFIGWMSISSAVVASTSVLAMAPTPRVVRGVEVNGVLEYAMTAMFLSLPGIMLLILRMVSFRFAGEGLLSRFGGRSGEREGEETGVPFTIEADGRYLEDQVITVWSEESRPTTAVVEERIARTWEAETASASASGRPLFNGSLARLLGVEATAERVRLDLGDTCYRDFLGTNILHADKVRGMDRAMLADAVGTSSLVLTSDGYIALGRRSDLVALHAGFLHSFGGMLESTDRRDGGWDVFAAIRRELREELDLRDREIEKIVLIGLARDRTILQPELVFEATVALDRSGLTGRFHPKLSGGEHVGVEFVPDDPEGVYDFLARAPRITAVAQAALLLHGRHPWGPNWHDRVCLSLYGALPAGAKAEARRR